MRTVFAIITGILVFGINFVLYCCLRIASKEDEMLEWEASREKKVGKYYKGIHGFGLHESLDSGCWNLLMLYWNVEIPRKKAR